jgi:carbohydrate-selective porin OprB
MNLKLMYMRDGLFTDVSINADADDDSNYGVEWDWKITDTIGVWAIFTSNNEDVNEVQGSWSIGAVLMGIIGSRPDDEIGIGVGMLTANRAVVDANFGGTSTGDTEMVVEAYYKYVTEDGKMQITPHLQYIGDPGVGATLTETSLFVLGVRIYIPF